jgi:hypothetical protein
LKILVLALLAGSCLLLGIGVAEARNAPTFHQINETRARADSIRINVKKRELTVLVKHNGGIGKTKIELETGDWPDNLKLVFQNFGALEGCKVSTSTRQFDASVPHSVKERIIQLGEGFSARRRNKKICIDAPPNFIRKNEKFLQLEWVDFYR